MQLTQFVRGGADVHVVLLGLAWTAGQQDRHTVGGVLAG